MDILKTLKRQIKGKAGRLQESAIYAEVMKEIQSGKRHDGIWAQAFSETEGNEKKADALYIKLRVQSLKDELKIHNDNLFKKKKNNQNKTISNENNDEFGKFVLFIFFASLLFMAIVMFIKLIN